MSSERVLVVAAHPDDESLGCGATIAKHVAAGDPVRVYVMADGVGARGMTGNTEQRVQRHGMYRRACRTLGTEDVWIFQFTDNAMDTVPLLEVVRYIEIHVAQFKPTVVYTHWKGDLNQDHRVVHDAVNIACRPQPGCTVKKLLYFEVPCSTAWSQSFTPNFYVDVSDTLPTKLKACEEYATEMRPFPHPRSALGITNLAATRGAHVGVAAAEAFVCGRIVT